MMRSSLLAVLSLVLNGVSLAAPDEDLIVELPLFGKPSR